MVAITVKSIKILNINLVFYFLKFQVKSCSHWGVLAIEGDGQRRLATSCVGSSQHSSSFVHLALYVQGGDVSLPSGAWR